MAQIGSQTRNHDFRLKKVKNIIIKAIVPIPELTDKLLNAKDMGDTPDMGKAIRQTLDSVALPTHVTVMSFYAPDNSLSRYKWSPITIYIYALNVWVLHAFFLGMTHATKKTMDIKCHN